MCFFFDVGPLPWLLSGSWSGRSSGHWSSDLQLARHAHAACCPGGWAQQPKDVQVLPGHIKLVSLRRSRGGGLGSRESPFPPSLFPPPPSFGSRGFG